MQKPKLSFWQIWNLSFGFLGVQIGYSLQNSNTSSIFKSLGADTGQLSLFWLAAPIAGMIVQPIIGMLSDDSWTKLGRRRPYIFGGALISTIALMLMPNCPRFLAFAPLIMGAMLLLFMDLSFNVTMQPFRALVSDMLDDSQKTKGYVIQTFLINLGAVIGGVLPWLITKIMIGMDVDMTVNPGEVPIAISWAYYIGGALLFISVLVTVFKVKEYPPKEFAEYNGIADADKNAPKENFLQLLGKTPKVMLQLGVTQFFSWGALFIMWTFLFPSIEGVVTNNAGMALSSTDASNWVGILNAVYPIPACIAAIFMTNIANKFGNKIVYAVCLLFGAIGFCCLPLLHNQFALMIPMIGIGIAYAAILSMPYAILSKALDARRTGVFMGIFNFTITIPQIVIGALGGLILKYFFDMKTPMMLVLAGVFMFLAAVSVYFVKDKSAN
ncbi:MAG: MFS transporter [Candidatus Cryptobacteroides sp.]